MAANQYGIDLGQLYRTKEAVEGARTQNRLSELKLGEAERQVAERPKKEAAAQERRNMLTGLRKEAAGGDVSAQEQLLAIDPEGGAQFIDALGKMDKRKREATQQTVEEMGQLSGYVLQGKTPEEQARRYELVRQGVSPEIQEKLPEDYNPQFMELSLSKAMAMDKLLENPKAVQVGNEDVVYKGGREIERKARPEKDSGKDGIKSSDENLMYRQAAAYFGGMIDPNTGQMSGIMENNIPKAQAIATEATKIYKSGNVTRSEAVELAAKKYGIQPASQDGAPPQQQAGFDPNDPLGLR